MWGEISAKQNQMCFGGCFFCFSLSQTWRNAQPCWVCVCVVKRKRLGVEEFIIEVGLHENWLQPRGRTHRTEARLEGVGAAGLGGGVRSVRQQGALLCCQTLAPRSPLTLGRSLKTTHTLAAMTSSLPFEARPSNLPWELLWGFHFACGGIKPNLLFWTKTLKERWQPNHIFYTIAEIEFF